jgi:4-amino-4-deoxy-L-arabinose transferase-like glycosyltransferase
VYHVLLPEDGITAPLNFAIAPYCPDASDNRVLSVPVDWLAFVPAVAWLPLDAPLWWTLLAVWVLVLLAIPLWLLERRLWASKTTAGAVARLCGPVAAVAGGLLAWAWFAPHTLTWMLSFALPVLVVATLVLAGVESRKLPFWQRVPRVLARVARWRALPAVLYGLLLVSGHVLLLLPLSVTWHSIAVWLLLLLAAVPLALLLFGFEHDPLLVVFLACCGGLALPVLLLLPIHVLPGVPPWWLLLLISDVLGIGLLVLLLRRRSREPSDNEQQAGRIPSLLGVLRSPPFLLLLIVLLAAALRLPFLGGAEFQGDEARAMLIAMRVQQGQDDILLFHRKGPVEALLPAAPLITTGTINEAGARLPFALAGLGTIIGGYLLGVRLFRGTHAYGVGLLASLVLALDGFLIAFSRIVQYQSVLVLLGMGALLCGWRFYQGTPHPRRYLLCAAVLAAVGLLAHYDGIYVLPPLAWLVLLGGRQYWQGTGAWLRGLAAPLAVGGVLVLGFYLPFFAHENFGNTIAYLSERVDPEEASRLLFNNLVPHYAFAAFYNTTVQVVVLAAGLAAGVTMWLLRYTRPRLAGWLLVGLWLVGCVLLVVAPGSFVLGERLNWAIVALGLPLVWLVFAPAVPASLRVLVIWFTVPFLAHAFIIADPRTHFYTIQAPGALLVGLEAVRLVEWLRARRLAWVQVPLAVGLAAMVLLAVPYLFIAFVRQSPEYQRAFPRSRPDFYANLSGDEVPWQGIFGFPHRDGWKVVGNLYDQGAFQGTYQTNQRDRVGTWYTRGAMLCEPTPDYYMLATWEGARLVGQMDAPAYPERYEVAACVLVDNMRMLNIYTQQPVEGPPQPLLLDEQSIAAFDHRPVENFPIREALNRPVPEHSLDAAWQNGARLVGYDMKRQRVAPGQFTSLALYWQLDQPLAVPAELVVNIRDSAGILVGSASPVCNSPPPSAWSPAYINTAMFSVQAAETLPPDSYTLHVSLLDEGEPLPLLVGAESVEIGRFVVEEE